MSIKQITCNHNGIYQLISIGTKSAWSSKYDKDRFEGLHFTCESIVKFTDSNTGLPYYYIKDIQWIIDRSIHSSTLDMDDCGGYSMYDVQIKKCKL